MAEVERPILLGNYYTSKEANTSTLRILTITTPMVLQSTYHETKGWSTVGMAY